MPQEQDACIKYNDSAIVHCCLHSLKFYEVELSEFPEKCTNLQSDRDERMWGVLTCKAKLHKVVEVKMKPTAKPHVMDVRRTL